MIHTIKNTKWVITTSVVCIFFGLITFFTFINQSFIELNDFNLQLLLFIDAILIILFFTFIIKESYRILKDRRKGKIGSATSSRYITFFVTTTLLPSILVAVFSLFLFNFGIQQYFNKKIKAIVTNSSEVANNYVEQTRASIESDIILMFLDINNKSNLFYDNPKRFLSLLATQRLLRKLDEVYLLDSSANIIMSNVIDTQYNFIEPNEEAFLQSLNGKPVRIIDSSSNRTSALIKLNNFIDTYLYVVKFMDPKLMDYLRQTNQAIGFYYTVQNQKTGIKITFAIIYILIVSLLLFLGIVISINFASRLTIPVVNLIGASEKISSGDLSAKVPNIDTDDEFKKLNDNFNSMIDRLKKQQEKLLLTERYEAWENVARKLAHEIKNPLTPIQLSIDRIREKYLSRISEDKKDFSNYLDTVAKQINDIEHLVNEFSDFARMPKPILKKINLNNIISRVLNLYKLSEKNIDFENNKANKSYFIKADEEQIHRVFLNLIKNSIESINEKMKKNVDYKGKISVDIGADSDYIYVNISDNGMGFEKVNKTKMLTPYFTTKKSGSGLGLAVVTKIVSDHNGLIDFTTIDKGAKVEVSLPKNL